MGNISATASIVSEFTPLVKSASYIFECSLEFGDKVSLIGEDDSFDILDPSQV
jgi:hypothetical protein